ncbi:MULTISPECIES: hypothetical protein [Dyella]|uniref:DUF883 family protein n=2 Tax=Dyella TaxID=231454 RepID=A0A4R0YST2_9GAMM|nr:MULTISPECIES: hypothetical protein [Dyella]TBR36782.1 hypothetical protein EYV96_12785 [Dyella terrae]TCI08127.1 hypothetical protein EZM97_26085 [Dyella soli]
MARNRDLESTMNGVGEHLRERAHHYASEAGDRAESLMERGREAGREARRRFGRNGNDYARRMTHAAEDFADEANYQYRRLRRQVARHPGATAAIVVGTVGAFFALRHLFRSRDDD